MSRRIPAPPPAKVEKVVIETFRDIVTYDVDKRRQDEPSCWSGRVCLHKSRVTVELVEEPVDVLQRRLQDLWETADNHHHIDPLRRAAAKLGYVLQGRMGSKTRGK